MFWFNAAVSINGFAILLLIGNALYDAFTTQHRSDHNVLPNLIGFALGILTMAAFGLKNSGNLHEAKILLWIPAAPLSLLFAFWLLYILVVLLTGKPDWR